MSRIVVSGTYCTGKTTLSLALSIATGIPATHALTMREILPVLYPGKTLRQCDYTQLITLGMRRFEDRIATESQLGNSFISDGCTLQEWLYGSTRMYTGAYPDEYPWKIRLQQLVRYRSYRDFKRLLRGFEGMAKQYARTQYDVFFHLPVEFDFVADGHRPTSERFRLLSEKRLLDTYDELGIAPVIVSGSLTERLDSILQHLRLTPVIPPVDAIHRAAEIRSDRFDRVALEGHHALRTASTT